jgi:polyisoprenoid-binding protein YceI
MSKKYLLIPVIAFFLTAFKPVPTTWKLDSVHSNLGFSIFHLSVSDLKGTVQIIEASLVAPAEDFTDATVTMKADMNSIDTDNEKRDAHLKTADFFDAVKFPELSFQSTSFKKSGADKYIVTGNLTMHGITKPVTLNASVKSGINPTNNKPITGMKITGAIKRTDFDVSSATPDAIISDEVAIEANLEFGKE